ncbi:isochorismatase family protein [Leptolyngbya sp. FACHB-711]|uniref:isochorismatase family protein n=1 Tax=unclassified Leptolyngbya TaxID=2650499 RepID=UPI001681F73D|nr:cysteine hydrolase [Cyanobacteria bacterium FACHB-502]MBD2024411.1 cysteine hydrolase [Leptolyngbya sp. FACHB-711]
MMKVAADPYAFPYQQELTPQNTALIVIDVQIDFCNFGGYLDQKGFDISLTRTVIQPIKALLTVARAKGFPIFHTREGHRSDLADLSEVKHWRSHRAGAEIGSEGPLGRILVRGEPGWQIVPELAPLPGEPVIDKPGNGAFYATDLDLLLQRIGVKNLVICGLTTAVCVHSTLREASDRGYDILLLEDCCAESDPRLHAAAIEMVKMEGGIFGTVGTSQAFISTVSSLPDVKEQQSELDQYVAFS